jgi:DNA-binding NtrC family response regulator
LKSRTRPLLEKDGPPLREGIFAWACNQERDTNPYLDSSDLVEPLDIIKRQIQAAWWNWGWDNGFHGALALTDDEVEEDEEDENYAECEVGEQSQDESTAREYLQRRDEQILAVLQQHNGNKAATARTLGVAVSTFKGWLDQIELRKRLTKHQHSP